MDFDPLLSFQGPHHPLNLPSEGGGDQASEGVMTLSQTDPNVKKSTLEKVSLLQTPAQTITSASVGMRGDAGVDPLKSFKIPKLSQRREFRPTLSSTAGGLYGFSDSDSEEEEFNFGDSSDEEGVFGLPRKRKHKESYNPDLGLVGHNPTLLYDVTGPTIVSDALEDSSIFDPQVLDYTESLSGAELQFLDKYVCDPTFDPDLMDRLTKDTPTPTLIAQAVRKPIDQEILEFFPRKGAVAATKADKPYMAIGTRLGSAFGPLTKVWSDLRKARDGKGDVDLSQLCQGLEKGMILLGQTHNAVLFARRANLLSKFVRNQKKANDLIAKNQSAFGQRDALFGKAFHTVLYRKAKHNKTLKEAQRLLAPPPKKFRRHFEVTDNAHGHGRGQHQGSHKKQSKGNSTQPGQQTQQPFRGGPPARGRGGGRGSQKGSAQSRYVSHSSFYSKARANYIDFVRSRRATKLRSHRFYFGRQQYLGSRPLRTSNGVSRGSLGISLSQLDVGNKRSMDSRYGSWMQGTMDFGTGADVRANESAVFEVRNGRARSRDCENDRQRGSRASVRRSRTNSELYFPSTKERWVASPNFQHEKPERICEISAFQNGRNSPGFRYGSTRGVFCKTRPEGCLFHSKYAPRRQEISQIPMAGGTVPIRVMPVRVSVSPMDLHKVVETSHCSAPENRGKDGDLFGRHVTDAPRSTNLEMSHPDSHLDSAKTGISDKLGEVPPGSLPIVGVPGFCDKFPGNEGFPSNGQGAKDSRSLQGASDVAEGNSERTVKTNRSVSGCSQSSSSRTSSLSTPSNAEDEGLVSRTAELRISSPIARRMQERVTMVEYGTGELERPFLHKTMSRPDCGTENRCVKIRLGSNMQWCPHSGIVVTTRESTAYKCTGNEGSDLCSESVYEGRSQQTHTCVGGQQHNGSKHQQDGEHQVSSDATVNSRTVELLHIAKDHDYCGTPSGGSESRSGCSVKDLQGQQQLAVESNSVPISESIVGTDGDGPFCRPIECTVTEIRKLETRSKCLEGGLISDRLDSGTDVCFPPVLPNKQSTSQGKSGSSRNDLGNTDMADEALVCQTVDNDSRSSNIASAPFQSLARAEGRTASNDSREQVAPSSMENIRKEWSDRGFSEKAISVMQQSRRPGTQNAYNSSWNKWHCWCVERGLDPFQSTLESIVNFLSELLDSGLEYSTINGYRSSISAFHKEIDGSKIGQHPIIKQFMAGAFNMKPPQPRYNDTWDVDKVLDYIRSLGDNGALTDKMLSLKVTMLLALTNASRAHELKNLNPLLMRDFGDKIVWPISALTKTKRPSKPDISLTITKFDEKVLDTVECVRTYLERTSSWRNNERRKTQLLLALVRPHNPVSTSTVSRWLKDLMQSAGICTAIFQGHSVRSAATSKVATMGLSVQQILERANWSNSKTFYRFYYRSQMHSDNFQDMLFQSRR